MKSKVIKKCWHLVNLTSGVVFTYLLFIKSFFFLLVSNGVTWGRSVGHCQEVETFDGLFLSVVTCGKMCGWSVVVRVESLVCRCHLQLRVNGVFQVVGNSRLVEFLGCILVDLLLHDLALVSEWIHSLCKSKH